MPLELGTYACISQLSEYCRSGEFLPAGEQPQGAMQLYRSLTLNVISDTLRRTFPILRSQLSLPKWQELVSHFFSVTRFEDPELWKMPKRLLAYAWEHKVGEKLGIAYLDDLLLFEWSEVELAMMPDLPAKEAAMPGDAWQSSPILNREFKMLSLTYPVFKRSFLECPDVKGEYSLLVFREPESGQVHFAELSKLFADTIQILAERDDLSGAQSLRIASERLKTPLNQELETHAQDFFTSLVQLKMILGVRLRSQLPIT